MARMRKVFLPRWIRWFVLPALALPWAFITYGAFATEEGRRELGWVGWLTLTLMFLLLGVMIWLMSAGKLPAYLIEEPEEQERDRR